MIKQWALAQMLVSEGVSGSSTGCATTTTHVRPHRALGRHTSAEAYAAGPKATASGIPLIAGHSASATSRSTPTANSPCATTADSTSSVRRSPASRAAVWVQLGVRGAPWCTHTAPSVTDQGRRSAEVVRSLEDASDGEGGLVVVDGVDDSVMGPARGAVAVGRSRAALTCRPETVPRRAVRHAVEEGRGNCLRAVHAMARGAAGGE